MFCQVFILDVPDGDIDLTKNIVVVDNDQTEAIFIEGFDGAVDDVYHIDNCYWNVDGSSINLGQSYGTGEIIADPLFVDYANENYYLQANSPASDWGAFPNKDAATRLVDLKINKEVITLFPNPAVDHFTIQGNFQDYSIQIMDAAGIVHTVLSNQSGSHPININHLPQGLYFIQLKDLTNNDLYMQQIIKQ